MTSHGAVVLVLAMLLAGCGTSSMEQNASDGATDEVATTTDAVVGDAPDTATDIRPSVTCNDLNLDGAPEAGIGGYGPMYVPAGTGGPIVDGTYVLVAGYISVEGEIWVVERRKLVVSAGRMEMIRELSDKTILTTVQTFTTSGANITLTDACPTSPTSTTYDYTSELSDAGRKRLVINDPFFSSWLTAFVYELQ